MITRVFKSGNSQAVRIPHAFQLDVSEVNIFRRGDELILSAKKPDSLIDVLDIFASMPDDFMSEGRHDPIPQQRDFE
jgi:antitoxin VapB